MSNKNGFEAYSTAPKTKIQSTFSNFVALLSVNICFLVVPFTNKFIIEISNINTIITC